MIESRYAAPASEGTLEKVAAALRENNIEVMIVDSAGDAGRELMALVPEGAEVHSGASKTLMDIGVTPGLEAGEYNWLRNSYLKMDRATHGREIRKMIGAPDYMLGSPQAITEDGAMLFASYAGSQIGPIASSAEKVILVAGSQKVVPDLAAGMERIHNHVMPYEDARLREQLGVPTRLAKLLVSYLEPRPGRTTVILVKQPVGV